MKNASNINLKGMLAIVFLFFLAYGPLLACCPTSNTNTVQEPGITSETSGDPMGEDVFFCRSWIPGGHAWVKIGGKKYNTNGDSGTSYGGCPSAMFGKPMLIYSPDEHENDWAVYYHRYKTTTVVEKQLEMWIKNTYYVEGSSKEDECERNKNPTYNLFFYNCRNFSESVEIHLNMILYSQVPMNKNNFFVLFIMPIF